MIPRRSLFRWAAGVGAVLIGGAAGLQTPRAAGRVIKITAKRFQYTPSEIEVRKGEAVTLEFRSLDRLHGWNLPDFKLRADIVPEKPTRVSFRSTKTGVFPFHCDNFCGDGHEDMTGRITVVG